MNSVFIPFIPSGMTVSNLKYALETHYGVRLIGIDMVANGRGYMFFAHFVHILPDWARVAIDATSQFKLVTESGAFFYIRRNTGTLDLSDPAVTQLLFYGDHTYSRGEDKFVYTFVDGEWVIEWLPQVVIDMYLQRQATATQATNQLTAQMASLTV